MVLDFFKPRRRKQEPTHDRFICVTCHAVWGEAVPYCTSCGGTKCVIPAPLETPASSRVTRSRIQSAAELKDKRLRRYWKLTKELDRFMGRLPRAFDMLVWGPPGEGKSTFVTYLANTMANAGKGSVLYAAVEEGKGDALIDRLQRVEASSEDLLISSASSWAEISADVDSVEDLAAVAIDSFSAARMSEGQLAALAERLDVPLIFTVHATKGGDPAGPAGLAHWVDIVIKVDGGKAKTTKNRHGALSKYEIFPSAAD